MMPKKGSSIAKLETSPEIAKFDLAVRAYLASHPPTLGHGYSHLKKVARLAYRLAEENSLSNPEVAYIAGLVHDLYRPAWGGGLERHTQMTSKEAKRLLKKTSFAKRANEVSMTLRDYDQVILEGKSTSLMEILSLADKSDMSFQRAVAYSWASNQCLRGKGAIAYSSFMETMRDFCLYQVKAWRVFLVVKIKGVKQAAEAYMRTHEDLIQAVRDELGGRITYQKKSLELARKEAEAEKAYLEEAGATKEEMRKIAQNFEEPIRW